MENEGKAFQGRVYNRAPRIVHGGSGVKPSWLGEVGAFSGLRHTVYKRSRGDNRAPSAYALLLGKRLLADTGSNYTRY